MRFSIRTLLLIMVVVSVTGAAASYLVRSIRESRDPMGGGSEHQFIFILMTLAAPMLLMVVLSLLISLFRRSQRKR